MLAGQAPDRHPTDISVALDQTALGELSHFHKAALVVSRKRMQVLESLTCVLFDTISDIRGFGKLDTAVDTPAREPDAFIPDPERITSAVRAMLVLWLAWLSLVYIGDIPGGTGLVAIAGPFGMAISTMPQVPISKLFKPLVTSLLFASVLYIFLMPKLSGFIGLGMMIFATTFTLCYLFAEPRQMLGRVFGLALFIVIAGISNDQTYNFLTITTTAMMFVIIFAILFITAQIPFSPRPERNVLRLLGRFFSSCEYLMATMRQDTGHTPTRLERWKALASSAFAARSRLLADDPPENSPALAEEAPVQVANALTELFDTAASEIIIVGAHYDSVPDCPAANDNGTGVAALLEIARLLAGQRYARSVRLVAFANEEPPFFYTEAMGSAVYAARARRRGERIEAMLALETLGWYTDQPGSQRYPFPFSLFYPDRGNFVGFVGNLPARGLVRRALAAFRASTPFPSEGVAAPGGMEGVHWSDHWSFWQAGYPAIMITDTALFRYPHYHAATDTPERLDYPSLARVTLGLAEVVAALAAKTGSERNGT